MKKFSVVFLILFVFQIFADENFKWSLNNGTIELEIVDKCYLYSNELKINAFDNKNTQLELILPQGKNYDDPQFGKTKIIPAGKYTITAENSSAIHRAAVSYQGCRAAVGDESGICFMPQDITLGVEIPAKEAGNQSAETSVDFKVLAKHEGTMSVEEMCAFLQNSSAPSTVSSKGKSVWFILFILLSGGLLLNFTPCILPMIPINLAIIGAGGEKNAFAGLMRGIYYAVGMTCAYGILGAAAILSGARFGELNSSMWFNWAIAVVFFALALAMAGVWNIDFSARQNSINPMKWKLARPIAIFLMGATAALLGGACVAPAVIGMLLMAVEIYKETPWAGILVPFVFGFGMGILWIAAGATMGRILPKPGKWMVYVKYFLAVLIALMGIYYLWIGFTLIPGKFSSDDEVQKFHNALKEAAAENKKVFVDFGASWCKNCSYMEQNVLSDPAVKKQLETYKVVKFQAEDLKDKQISNILEQYEVKGLPAFVILEKKK